jgi:hypothetical protein
VGLRPVRVGLGLQALAGSCTPRLRRKRLGLLQVDPGARGDAAAALRRENTQAAIAADVIGVPAYVLDGEAFWGQDRIDLLDRALSSGRAPYRPL